MLLKNARKKRLPRMKQQLTHSRTYTAH